MTECYVRKVAKYCRCKPHYAFGMKEFKSIDECKLKDIMDVDCERQLAGIKQNMSSEYCECMNPCNKTTYRKLKKGPVFFFFKFKFDSKLLHSYLFFNFFFLVGHTNKLLGGVSS